MFPFEVRCHSCNVSFPVGTRRCLHCGGPTGPPLDPSVPQELTRAAGGPLSSRARLPGVDSAEDGGDPEEAEQPSRAGIRITTLVWLALALVASLWRMCADAGQG